MILSLSFSLFFLLTFNARFPTLTSLSIVRLHCTPCLALLILETQTRLSVKLDEGVVVIGTNGTHAYAFPFLCSLSIKPSLTQPQRFSIPFCSFIRFILYLLPE